MKSNSNRLDLDEFLPYAPDTPGSVAITHCHAPKRKLYVTRNSDGSVMAFCHHCTARGFYRSTNMEANQAASIHQRTAVPRNWAGGNHFGIPDDAEGSPDRWRLEALDWTRQFLTDTEIADSPLCYSNSRSAIIFPFVNDTDIVMYQERAFPERDPKYMTYWNPNAERIYNPIGVSDTLVITEDWISAYKAHLVGYSGFPAAGSNIPTASLARIMGQQYRRYVVALDNDNPNIRREQRKLERTFSQAAPTLLLKLTRDLKYYSVIDIRDMVES